MSLKINTEEISVSGFVYNGCMEQSLELDILLPDYCPDITKILKCKVTPVVLSNAFNGDKLTVEGKCKVLILYTGDDCGSIRCYETQQPFATTFVMKSECDYPVASVSTRVDYINCRAITQRKIDLRGAFTIEATVTTKERESIITDAEDCGIQLKKCTVPVSCLTATIDKAFAINEVLSIPDEKESAQVIIKSDAVALVDDYKAIANKIIIKGNVKVDVLYYCDVDKCLMNKFSAMIPMSQIVDIDGITENDNCLIDLSVLTCETQIQNNMAGDTRLIDCDVKLNCVVSAYSERDVPIVCDCYSTQFNCNEEKKEMAINRVVGNIDSEETLKLSMNTEGRQVVKIVDTWCVLSNVSCASEDDKSKNVCVKGDATITVLCIDSEGAAFCCEETKDFEFPYDIGEHIDNMHCFVNAGIKSANTSISGADCIDVTVCMVINGGVMDMSRRSIISDIQIDEDQPKQNTRKLITIYFAQKGETVWDIARKYNTSVEAIMQENELSDDMLDNKVMLLIPMCNN